MVSSHFTVFQHSHLTFFLYAHHFGRESFLSSTTKSTWDEGGFILNVAIKACHFLVTCQWHPFADHSENLYVSFFFLKISVCCLWVCVSAGLYRAPWVEVRASWVPVLAPHLTRDSLLLCLLACLLLEFLHFPDPSGSAGDSNSGPHTWRATLHTLSHFPSPNLHTFCSNQRLHLQHDDNHFFSL